MKNKSKFKKQNIGNDDTIFEIDNSNRGQINLSQFRKKSKSKSKSKLQSRSKSSESHNPDRNSKRSKNSQPDRESVVGVKRAKRNGKVKRNIGSEAGMKEAVGLRVVGGRFRGSRLIYGGDNRVRPMKDRVREAVFNLIGPDVRGKHVIDLFGGTGALTIEALSRGATSATIIEMHLPTALLLRKNLEALNLINVCKLCKTDAFFWSKNLLQPSNRSISLPPNPITPSSNSSNSNSLISNSSGSDDVDSWLVFCSPPYSYYVDFEGEVLEMLDNLFMISPVGSIFVIESDERFDFARLPIPTTQNKTRSYPPAKIIIITKLN
ncbi:MAG: RsmD family RNA methyltransferase [Planctomycetaceae bacterium]|jgi:16S rRNA (guanine966-N2)-methyltransferase|nr:RsmD family RNA methyltransferase [Planctomycetaceae bacterium]